MSGNSDSGGSGSGGEDFSPAELEEMMSSATFSRGTSGRTGGGTPLSAWNADSTDEVMEAAAGTGFDAFKLATPVSEIIKAEEAEDREAREYEWRIRSETFVMILREAFQGSCDIINAGANLAVWAWDLQIPEFKGLTQNEIARQIGQGRAAICERHKRVAEEKKKAAGMRGSRSSRQKRAGVVDVLAESAKGNTNRRKAAGTLRLNSGPGRRRRQ